MVDRGRKFKILCKDQSLLPEVADELLEFGKNERVWLFEGEMGAGKTTLIKAMCKQLNSIDTPSSPTFNLINEYLTEESEPLFHFDFYRIIKEEEAYDIGTEEYFDSGYYCFVEWPDKIMSLWPDHYIEVRISSDLEGVRTMELQKYD